MSKKNNPKQGGRCWREMTVAFIREHKVREGKEADGVEVAFSESARFYRLSRRNPKFATILRALQNARDRKQTVRVEVDFPEGDLIHDATTGTSTQE